jgi:hypothetical protein
MLISVGLLVVLLPALLIALQMRRALGWKGAAAGLVGTLLVCSAWGVLESSHRNEPPVPEDLTATTPVTAAGCFKCHESHHESWQRTFHRTMTREATPEYVKGDFNDAVHQILGVTSNLTRRGDRFFLDTVDPRWAEAMRRAGQAPDPDEEVPRHTFTVDRLVGSHWFQQLLSRDRFGRYIRLPLTYHIVEKRWIHTANAFLGPEPQSFYDRLWVWNESCLYCHNTRPVKNAKRYDNAVSYRTTVGELGISCEACHGAGELHVRAHQNPASRLAQRYADEPDPTIVNPARLSAARADEICARCHGGISPRLETWGPSQADPYLAGRDLARFWRLYWSETEMRQMQDGLDAPPPPRPNSLDCFFWSDGTPLTTAKEYQGMALAACYKGGHGTLRCLSCHTMHHGDPNHQVKDGMRTNAACYECHESYRTRLQEHTHHAADSPGSLCYNCHMPYQVYSLLTTHRSHRIMIPRVKDTRDTGRPHACNLCHLDKSLGWTQTQLKTWYGTEPEKLSADEAVFASSLWHLTQSDARSRAVVAGAFSWPPAHQASGTDWPVLLLTRTLEHERYAAVRYLAHRALRQLYGAAANDYNFEGNPAERDRQLRALRLRLESAARPDRGRYPYLPLTAAGGFADDVYQRLLRTRSDPDVTVNE